MKLNMMSGAIYVSMILGKLRCLKMNIMNVLKLFFISTMLCSCSSKEYHNGVNPSCAQKETYI